MQEFRDGAKELAKVATFLSEQGINTLRKGMIMRVLEQLELLRYQYRSSLVPYVKVDRAHQIRPSENGNYDGHIPQCSTARCGFACCEVNSAGLNTIKLAKGELDRTRLSVSHLTIIEDLGESGCRATCNNGCDGGKGCGPDSLRGNQSGYKPYDCDDYPWFNNLDNGKVEFWVSDHKCPLPATAKLTHLPGVFNHLLNQLNSNQSAASSYEGAIKSMVGYKMFNPQDLEALSVEDFEITFAAGIQLALNKEKQTLLAVTDDALSTAMDAYEAELRRKAEQALNIVRQYDGIKYTHLQY